MKKVAVPVASLGPIESLAAGRRPNAGTKSLGRVRRALQVTTAARPLASPSAITRPARATTCIKPTYPLPIRSSHVIGAI